MSGSTIGFPQCASVRQWNESTSINPHEVFSRLGQALVTLKRKDWETAARSCFEGAVSQDPAGWTYVLIWKSLSKALFELTWELAPWLTWMDPAESAALADQLDFSFVDQDLTVDLSVFHDPEDCPILHWMKPIYRDWVKAMGMEEPLAAPAVDRLTEYFADSFMTRWRAEPSGPVQEALDAQPEPLNAMDWAWAVHDRRLRKLSRASFFDQEPYDLSQAHVPSRAFQLRSGVSHPDFKELEEYLFRHGRGLFREVFDLETRVLDWIERLDADDPVRLIASISAFRELTMSRILALRINQKQNHRCLLLALDWASLSAIRDQGLDRVLTRQGGFPENPLGPANGNVTLVLTLPVQIALENDLVAGLMLDFLQSLSVRLGELNEEEPRVSAILIGMKEPLVHVQRHLQTWAPIFHTLPYVLPDDQGPEFSGPRELIEQDQREQWWQCRGRLIGRGYQGLPKELAEGSPLLSTLTAHPIFGYLLAKMWEQDPESVRGVNNLADLLRANFSMAFCMRVLDEHKPYQWLYRISLDEFTNIMGEIAIHSWHHPFGQVAVARLRRNFDHSGLGEQLSAVIELTEAGAIRCFLTLNADETGASSLSFSYRGLRTLLVAQRLLLELDVIREGFDQRKGHPARGLDEYSALGRLFRLCGPARVCESLFHYLDGMMQRRDTDELAAWQECLIRLINLLMNEGWPLRAVVERSTSERFDTQTRNTEEALLVLAGLCARLRGQRYSLDWPSPLFAANWIGRLLMRKGLFHKPMVLQCLGFLDLSGCHLDGLNFQGGDLKNIALKKASLNHVCLVGADLEEADLTDSTIHHANLDGVVLKRAYLRRVNLDRSILRGADLRECDLGGASVFEGHLRGADLRWADLRQTNLRGANLVGADLRWAYVDGTDFRGADLRGADLRETDLSQANLEGAEMSWADYDQPLDCGLPDQEE